MFMMSVSCTSFFLLFFLGSCVVFIHEPVSGTHACWQLAMAQGSCQLVEGFPLPAEERWQRYQARVTCGVCAIKYLANRYRYRYICCSYRYIYCSCSCRYINRGRTCEMCSGQVVDTFVFLYLTLCVPASSLAFCSYF